MDRGWLKKYVILLAVLALFAGAVWYAFGQREDSVENAVLASAEGWKDCGESVSAEGWKECGESVSAEEGKEYGESVSAEEGKEYGESVSAGDWEQECCLAWPGKAGRADG